MPTCAVERLPYAFKNAEKKFTDFCDLINAELELAGYGNAEPILQGSAVTGVSFASNRPFGKRSDFDIALVSPDLVKMAIEHGIEYRSEGMRTAPLQANELDQLDLRELAQKATKEAGYQVNFMIYQSRDHVMQRHSISLRSRRSEWTSPATKPAAPVSLIPDDAGWPSLTASTLVSSPYMQPRSTRSNPN